VACAETLAPGHVKDMLSRHPLGTQFTSVTSTKVLALLAQMYSGRTREGHAFEAPARYIYIFQFTSVPSTKVLALLAQMYSSRARGEPQHTSTNTDALLVQKYKY
jgi:hypothetical protein